MCASAGQLSFTLMDIGVDPAVSINNILSYFCYFGLHSYVGAQFNNIEEL